MNHAEFLGKVRRILSKETSSDPEHWTVENPFWGHCVVITLLAQDFFGGEILRASLENTAFNIMRSHYWNQFQTGEQDFSQDQFRGTKPDLVGALRNRQELLSNSNTLHRYQLLQQRFATLT